MQATPSTWSPPAVRHPDVVSTKDRDARSGVDRPDARQAWRDPAFDVAFAGRDRAETDARIAGLERMRTQRLLPRPFAESMSFWLRCQVRSSARRWPRQEASMKISIRAANLTGRGRPSRRGAGDGFFTVYRGCDIVGWAPQREETP